MNSPLRILLVEDNLDDALLLEAELSGEFALEMLRVDTPAGLREALAGRAWDVVISDYRLPQFDGIEALKMVREVRPDLPFILVSGAVGEELAAQAMQAGANGFILKQNLSRLADAIRNSLVEAEARRQHAQMEAALQESERRFRIVASESPYPMMIHAEDGEVLLVNQAWTDISGYDLTDIPTTSAWVEKGFDEDRRASAKENIGQLYGITQRIDEGESVIHCKDGSRRTWSFNSSPLGALPDGRRAVISMAVDITERQRAKQELEASKAFAERVMASSLAGLYLFDRVQRRHVYVNVQFTRLTGYTLEEVQAIGEQERLLEMFHPDDRQDVMSHLLAMKHVPDSEMREIEYRFRHKNGQWRWLLSRETPFSREPDGTLREFLGTFIDITERKLAETRGKRVANLYRALSETNDAIIHQDSEAELLHRICRIATEYSDALTAWVGVPDANHYFRPVAVYGEAASFVDAMLKKAPISSLQDQPSGHGPSGIAFREGRPIVVNNIDESDVVVPWGALAADFGIRAAAVIPIMRRSRPYAIFAIYSGQSNTFDEEIVHLLNEMAGNIGFALDNVDREAERRRNEEELQLAALVYHESAEAMMVTDEADRIVSVNPAFEKLTGYSGSEVIGKNPMVLSAGPTRRPSYRDMLQRLKKSHYWQGELWLKKKSGEDFAAGMTVNTTFHADGSVNRHVTLFVDVTERKQAEELVWQQANFDTLTGLPNRQHFLDQLGLEIRKSRRSRLPFALMFLDLDGFKYVNDTFGHEAGDNLLREAADRLKRCVRESDTVARLGGDEFTIVLSELRNVRYVEQVARHILHKLAEPFEIGDQVARVSGSIGITLFPQDAKTVDDMLVNADQAMYAAKESGKNRYRFFTEAMQQAAQERVWLINELRRGIQEKQFRLVYQPIVELATGCINKVEALLRWEHPERGPIEPSVFIPIAEETGMIQEIGDWVFLEAANQVVKWRQTFHPDFQISINRSPIQFKSRESDVGRWLEGLKNLNLPGQALAIEITEGVLMDESAEVQTQLLAYRDAGVEVSLDDFGTGYSSMSYLKRFDIDRLKIDQTFVRDLEKDPNDQALIEAMIVMGHKLGLKVIAEGVETERQRELLANAGCDFIQGFLLSTPVSAHELDAILAKGVAYCPGLPATEIEAGAAN